MLPLRLLTFYLWSLALVLECIATGSKSAHRVFQSSNGISISRQDTFAPTMPFCRCVGFLAHSESAVPQLRHFPFSVVNCRSRPPTRLETTHNSCSPVPPPQRQKKGRSRRGRTAFDSVHILEGRRSSRRRSSLFPLLHVRRRLVRSRPLCTPRHCSRYRFRSPPPPPLVAQYRIFAAHKLRSPALVVALLWPPSHHFFVFYYR